MKVNITNTEKGTVIKLEGKMMLGYEANDFHEAVLTAIEKNINIIVVDLCEVQFISSWGIGILMYGFTSASNAGCSFKLACVPENVNKTFAKVKLDTIFEQYDSIDEAFNS